MGHSVDSKPWIKHEAYVNEVLGLSSTVASGSQWHDPSDGTNREHPTEIAYPLMVDCKLTEHLSFGVRSQELRQWMKKARMLGKVFVMPLRFVSGHSYTDYVVVPLSDFVDILESARKQRGD